MPKGGARARAGRPHDPDALRRERPGDRVDGEWTLLPADGRVGEVPAWPLTDQTAREAVLWAEQWSRPQALMWERNGQALEVAMFVRALVEAESPRAVVAARTLVRQQMDSLGLSVPGLRANRWRIVDENASSQQADRPARREAPSVKERLRLVKEGDTSA